VSVQVVIDANSIYGFQMERLKNHHGVARKAVTHIFNKGFIATDDGNFIIEEWCKCAGFDRFGINLRDWYADRLHEGKIKPYRVNKPTPINRALGGFKMKLADRMYVFTAVESKSAMIVTYDIDFHDPKKKSAKKAEKIKIKKSKKGPVCKYIQKTLGIRVGRMSEVKSTIK